MQTLHWTLERFAQHYADTLRSPPNGWGQHVSPIFGQSHHIIQAACKYYPLTDVTTAFRKAVAASG